MWVHTEYLIRWRNERGLGLASECASELEALLIARRRVDAGMQSVRIEKREVGAWQPIHQAEFPGLPATVHTSEGTGHGR